MKKLSVLLLVVILMAAILLYFSVRGKGNPGTVLSVDPQTTTVGLGNIFTIDINITSDVLFGGYEYKLYWDKTLLNPTAAVDTPPPAWTSPFQLGPGLEPDYNTTHGRYFRGYVNTPCTPVSGNYTLTTLTFNATALGSCTLALRDTRVADHQCDPLSHTAQDGNVHVIAPPCVYPVTWNWLNRTNDPVWFTANVAISGCCLAVQNFNFNRWRAEPSPGPEYSLGYMSFDIVSPGSPGSCNVTVPKLLMDGGFKVLINDTVVPSILAWNKSHTFVWFSYSPGTYNVKIVGEMVTRIRSVDLLTLADVNGDGVVNIVDVVVVALRFDWSEYS